VNALTFALKTSKRITPSVLVIVTSDVLTGNLLLNPIAHAVTVLEIGQRMLLDIAQCAHWLPVQTLENELITMPVLVFVPSLFVTWKTKERLLIQPLIALAEIALLENVFAVMED